MSKGREGSRSQSRVWPVHRGQRRAGPSSVFSRDVGRNTPSRWWLVLRRREALIRASPSSCAHTLLHAVLSPRFIS